MRTNKACPLYSSSGGAAAPVNVAMTEEQEEEIERQLVSDDQDLVNVEGTKVKLSGKLIKVRYHANLCFTFTYLLKYFKSESTIYG